MFTCTPEAAATLQEVAEANDVPDGFGVRLFLAPSPEGDVGLGINFTDEPATGDQVTEQHGTKLMVASEISEQLDGLMLDVVADPASDGDQARQLVLRSQDEET